MLIEDVACPVENLGAMTMDLVEMFQKYGYHDASCFGHALEGNLHLVFSQVSALTQPVSRHNLLHWAALCALSCCRWQFFWHPCCAKHCSVNACTCVWLFLVLITVWQSARAVSMFWMSAGRNHVALTAVCVQGFRTAEEVDRFGQLMDELCYIVATKHSGSLKVCLWLSSSVACWL